MIGRAGRPQHDTTGTAIIMTDSSNNMKYQSLISGKLPIESSLHLNLCEHLNAEIGLKTINNIHNAILWIKKSFLYVRIQKNSNFYAKTLINNKDNDTYNVANIDWEKRLENIIEDALEQLIKYGLVERYDGDYLRCTGKQILNYY